MQKIGSRFSNIASLSVFSRSANFSEKDFLSVYFSCISSLSFTISPLLIPAPDCATVFPSSFFAKCLSALFPLLSIFYHLRCVLLPYYNVFTFFVLFKDGFYIKSFYELVFSVEFFTIVCIPGPASFDCSTK